MSKLIVIENEFITLWYHPIEKIVHHQFLKKTIYGKYFHEALNKGIELFKEHDASKWLSDDRSNLAFTQEDIYWSMNEWFPRAIDAGWKCWAVVQPEMVIGKININQFTTEYSKKGLTVKLFDDPANAFNWLKGF